VEATVLDKLRAEVLEANLELSRRGLALYTFGNASAVSRADRMIAIKPSGVPYEKMKPSDIVITDLDGNVISGSLRPSSDLPTHAALYRSFPEIGGVVHTHSRHATAWAQAGQEIPVYGTTHADYFAGPVPLTQQLARKEIEFNYELNTGLAIVRRMQGLEPLAFPGVLVASHAPFCWGETVTKAVHNAVVLEELAALALETIAINPKTPAISMDLHRKHHSRKHGPKAYYGQV
jgi:L-ribulose-5-phosphate 4-epimerase